MCEMAFQAGALGVEPRSTASKAGVLPLHHAPVFKTDERV